MARRQLMLLSQRTISELLRSNSNHPRLRRHHACVMVIQDYRCDASITKVSPAYSLPVPSTVIKKIANTTTSTCYSFRVIFKFPLSDCGAYCYDAPLNPPFCPLVELSLGIFPRRSVYQAIMPSSFVSRSLLFDAGHLIVIDETCRFHSAAKQCSRLMLRQKSSQLSSLFRINTLCSFHIVCNESKWC